MVSGVSCVTLCFQAINLHSGYCSDVAGRQGPDITLEGVRKSFVFFFSLFFFLPRLQAYGCG